METGAKVEIDLESYLGRDAMQRMAGNVWHDLLVERMHSEDDIERILTNEAYSIVGKLVEEKHHIDLERFLTEKVGKLVSDEKSLGYVLVRDDREYGGTRVGIVLSTLERIVQTKFQYRLEQIAENVVNSIDFKGKKFQKMVTEEVAKIVAKKIQRG